MEIKNVIVQSYFLPHRPALRWGETDCGVRHGGVRQTRWGETRCRPPFKHGTTCWICSCGVDDKLSLKKSLHLYRAFIQSVLQFLTFTHSYIDMLPTMQGNNQHVRSRWCLAQGHLDTWQGRAWGSNQQPSCCQTTAPTSWATTAASHEIRHVVYWPFKAHRINQLSTTHTQECHFLWHLRPALPAQLHNSTINWFLPSKATFSRVDCDVLMWNM